jgi:hypothetical protein
MVIERDGSVLRNLSHLAESYLQMANGNVVQANHAGNPSS